MLYETKGPANIDSLLATTTNHWIQNSLEPNTFNLTPFLAKMYEKAKRVDGGASIITPILYEDNSTGTWYSGYDTLQTIPQEGMTSSQAHWKNYAVSITISGDELRKNSGRDKVIGLLEGKTMQAEMTLKQDMTSALFASSTSADHVECLTTMIDATSSIQDINSTSYSWWQSTSTTGGSFAGQGLSDMRTTYTTLNKLAPEGTPDIIVTTDTVYNYYEGSLTPQTRYTPGGTYESSPDALKFKGATVFYDSGCNSGVMYMFPSKHLYLVINSNGDHKTTEYVKPANQDAKTAQIIVMLQLVTNARRKLGKIISITA
jgi:hypothetical protein